jgi:methylmalonyl-CoA mutase cobalamin-binding subunit
MAVARIAVENDVHAIGILCISPDGDSYITELLTSLKAEHERSIVAALFTIRQAEKNCSTMEHDTGKLIILDPPISYTDAASQILNHMAGD